MFLVIMVGIENLIYFQTIRKHVHLQYFLATKQVKQTCKQCLIHVGYKKSTM